jgi:hypothetical protein
LGRLSEVRTCFLSEGIDALFPVAAELAAVLHFDGYGVAAVPPDEVDFAAARGRPKMVSMSAGSRQTVFEM